MLFLVQATCGITEILERTSDKDVNTVARISHTFVRVFKAYKPTVILCVQVHLVVIATEETSLLQ